MGEFNILKNKIDFYIFKFVGYGIVFNFTLWIIVNTIGIPYKIVWFVIAIISFIIMQKITSRYEYSQGTHVTVKPYIVLFCLLFLTILYFIEPLITYPLTSIGIPNKDLHDGITKFISIYGIPPYIAEKTTTSFILNSSNGIYLGYPNALHALSAFFIHIGSSEFHATWLAVVLTLSICSLSIFLLLKTFVRPYIAAIAAGLFGLSSFRLPFAAIASIPMFYSYTLVIPSFLLFVCTIYHAKKETAYLMPIIATSLLAASYSGTIAIFFALLGVLFIFLFVGKQTLLLKKGLFLFIWCLIFLIPIFLLQEPIYWRNTFATKLDYDPYELAQRVMPVDMPNYMIVFAISVFFILRELLKTKMKVMLNPIFTTLLVIVFLSLIAISYDLFFHYIWKGGVAALPDVNQTGLFGGLNHQRVARLSLLQPFIFIFFVYYLFELIQHKTIRYVTMILAVVSFMIVRGTIPLYQPVQKELYASFYNSNSSNTWFTRMSDYRLVTNEKIWNKSIFEALQYLKRLPVQNLRIIVWDDRQWTEETIADWGSIIVEASIVRSSTLFPKTGFFSMGSLTLAQRMNFTYFLYIADTEKEGKSVDTMVIPNARIAFHQSEVTLFQLNPIVLQ